MNRGPGRLDWPPIIERAAEIVVEYNDNGTEVMLRQLGYRLFVEQLIRNVTTDVKTLSRYTAAGRRNKTFPDLIDPGRVISRMQTSSGPKETLEQAVRSHQRDRTEGQEWAIYLGSEKLGFLEQLWDWFGGLAVPIVTLKGFSSQTYVDDIAKDARRDGRPAVLIYAGDFDASGMDIERDATERTNGCFDKIIRIALNPDQIFAQGYPVLEGKHKDSRAPRFIARHRQLFMGDLPRGSTYKPGTMRSWTKGGGKNKKTVHLEVPPQVELEAIDPLDLRGLYQDVLDQFWDMSAYEASLARERQDQDALREFIDGFEDGG
ncbi:MAG: hypothetical protein M3454_00840 [Actinomycetota bacterium]|nr:hypothetical protein [Actinomycetota bacterium]